MRISQILENSTTSGAIAPVSTGFSSVQSRNASIYGDKKVGNLFKGKKTKQKYANSVNESKRVEEAKLEEDDLIIVPGQGRKLKSGFIPHKADRTDHEVEMALSDLYQAAKNAKKVYEMVSGISEEQGLEGWVQEKIIKANDYLNTIREYLEHKQMTDEGTLGALAGGAAGAYLGKSLSAANLGAEIGSALQDKLSNESVMPGGVIAGGIAGESIVKEKAKSKAQQKFMGMVHAVQKGEMKAPSKKVAQVAKGMTKKAGHEFAATKHKGLPEKVKKD